jgi:hypothetical protein
VAGCWNHIPRQISVLRPGRRSTPTPQSSNADRQQHR